MANDGDISGVTVHDVIIIGAGPAGLAVAARLCEHTPSAIFTDEEHRRYHWIRKNGTKTTILNQRNNTIKPAESSCGNVSTLVLDATAATWMAEWNMLLEKFEIEYLRSPMFFHPDPGDRDGLLAFTYEQDREQDLQEISNCVGKEVSKHHKKRKASKGNIHRKEGFWRGPASRLEIDERDRKDYYSPSTALFSAYCDCVVQRYKLNKNLVRQEGVQDIDFGIVKQISDVDDIFTVTTNKGVHHARTVVLAVGAGNAPSIPDAGLTPPMVGQCHAMQIKEFPDPSVHVKMRAKKETNVLVVGGGLTSAQVADLAVSKGVTRVWHVMRSELKVKHFDVDLAWVGKFRNIEQSAFWSSDCFEARLQQIQAARGGGSMTPTYHKILKKHMGAGRLILHTKTNLKERTYDLATQTWQVSTFPNRNLPPIDYIYFATGIATGYSTLPYLQTLRAKHPISDAGGLPSLNEDL
ncbi:hypothetical protein B0A49_03969, partial [Cryomyces minteri]